MRKPTRKPIAIIAVGGNSLITDKDHQSIPDQYRAVYRTAGQIIPLIRQGWRIVLTHGNGPQVGFVLRRSELARAEVPSVPMDYAGADIQGAVGYMFVQAFENLFHEEGIANKCAAVVTRVEVDAADPAFKNPAKPIGSYLDEATATRLASTEGWSVAEDAGRGWRRVVPSPRPMNIRDIDTIQTLIEKEMVVIACGGGGIPVCADKKGLLNGIEAVIDKDLASSLLAREMKAEKLVISTAVPQVAINFGKPDQRWLAKLNLKEARKLYGDGHFLPGSMGPKVLAVIEFVEQSGYTGIITDLPHLSEAIEGDAGTHITAQ